VHRSHYVESQMNKGSRTINGRVYDLVSRWPGIDAAERAAEHASKIRASGGMARCIKHNRFDVAVYALGGEGK
jgi:hypothetical protein